ncbi:MAG: hypothetical protein ACHRHE_19475 [Tepidisphaerales bacterium]
MNMRFTLCSLMVAAALALLAGSADSVYAQADQPDVRRPAPRRDGDPAAGGPVRGDRAGRLDPQDRPPRPEGGPGGGPGMLDGPRQPGDGLGPRPLRPIGPGATADNLRNYLEMVDRYHQVSRDPTAAGVAAVMSTVDVLRPRGAQAAIDYFTKILPNVKNDAVSRAIRLQLVELYKVTNQSDKALEVLEKLMTDAPASTGK